MKARASREVQQHRFDLIAARVCCGDELTVQAERGLCEEGVSGVSASLFQADLHVGGHLRHIGPAAQEGDAEFGAEGLAELEFELGLLPLAVMEVSGHDVDPELVEEVEEARAVGASGVADKDAGPRGNERGLFEMPAKPFLHRNRIPVVILVDKRAL